MKTYDVTLQGYIGGTDKTDHLVKWIRAANSVTLERWLKAVGLWDHCVASSAETPNVRWVDMGDHGGTYDCGIDVFLLDVATGDHVEVEYIPGSWQQTEEPFDPQTWIEESLREGRLMRMAGQ